MRSLLLFGMLAACGRFGFDGSPATDGDVIDGRAVLDAAPCTAIGNDDDNDGVVDACDACPYLPNAEADADGDGVGDACDPTGANESMTIFDPFTGSAFDPRWTVGGDVTIGNSVARFDSRGGIAFLAYSDVPDTTEIAIRGTILEIAPGDKQLSLQFGEQTNPDAEYCEVYGDPGEGLKLTRAVGSTYSSFDFVATPALATGPFVMRFRHSAAGFACELTMGGQTYAAAGVGGFVEPRSLTYIQFINMLVTVDSFVEIEPAP
jgi:Thrombospondin type 3 repeat